MVDHRWVHDCRKHLDSPFHRYVACLIIWIFRTRGEVPPEAIVDRTLPPDVAAELAAIPWYLSFNFWATVLVLAVIALYVRFF